MLLHDDAAAMCGRLLCLVSRDAWSLGLACRRLNQGQYVGPHMPLSGR